MLQTAVEGVGPSRNGCIVTKNRARKQATRQRAALTGERYVVAQRAVAEPLPHSTSALHDLMHKVPGVPAHVDGGLQARASRPTSRPGEPRVLVTWQNWIARRLGVDHQ